MRLRKLSIIVISFLFLGLFCIKPLIISLAKKQLGKVFVQSRISVSGCRLSLNNLSFSDIEITRQGEYSLKVKEAGIQYKIALLNPPDLRLFLKNANVSLNNPSKKISDFASYLKLNKNSPHILSLVDISGLTFDINTQDLSLEASMSLALNLITQSLEYVDLKIASFEMLGAQIEGASLNIARGFNQGDFSLPLLKYDKLNITDIKGKMQIKGTLLSLKEVSARALDGDIKLEIDLNPGNEMQYFASLRCDSLNIEKFISDFNLKEKFNMTGRLTGSLRLRGKGANIELLDGYFSALPSGGALAVKDAKFLSNMARNTGQAVDLLVESFKNYNYNTGIMTLGLNGSDVIFKVELGGHAGKRSLEVVLHDFRF